MLVLRAGLKSSYGSLFLIGVFMYLMLMLVSNVNVYVRCNKIVFMMI